MAGDDGGHGIRVPSQDLRHLRVHDATGRQGKLMLLEYIIKRGKFSWNFHPINCKKKQYNCKAYYDN